MASTSPKVLVLHGRDSTVSRERVSTLVDRLRAAGLDCRIGTRTADADFVLLVWSGEEDFPASSALKLVLVLFEDAPAWSIPRPLQGFPQFRGDTEDGREELLRYLASFMVPKESILKGGYSRSAEEDGWMSHHYQHVSYEVPPPTPPPGAAPPPAEPEDPPRTAYARLDAPDVAVAEEEIEVVVGLAAEQSPGVAGPSMTRPDSSVGSYTLTVQLVAEGFRLRAGETWRRELEVTAKAAWPAAIFHLTPEPQEEEVRPRSLQALYTVSGQTMGMAFRPMVVKRSAEADVPELAGVPATDIAIQTDAVPPDLEVRISLDVQRDSLLLWTFSSCHPGLDLPDEPLRTDIGSNPKGFARLLVDRVNAKEGKKGIDRLLSGIGESVSAKIPGAFWSLLRAVATRVGGPPSVLILSAEPYVPWELAKVADPLLDPAAPPFLAAQANVGRWALPRQEEAAASRQRPPCNMGISAMAVVTGIYDRPGWSRLKEAEAEAEELGKRFKAGQVNAATQPVFDCLDGDPAADLLHFAVHGSYDPDGPQDGLMLVDGEVLDPLEVKGTRLARSPFVFLNACQVGSGNQTLGDYSGMAEAFLTAGASGVVAPLWSVKDTIARDIALFFYEKTAEEGMSPAAALREVRRSFLAENGLQSATWLAYQYFGHPSLKLRFSIP